MARTQAADYQQRREAILDRAAQLYADKGFLGASVSHLAEALGASKSLIYHYYPSKEDILYEVMDSHLRDLRSAMDAVLGTGLDPADKLRELSRSFMKLYVHAAPRHKVLLNELDNLPAERRSEIIERQRALIQGLEALLVQIQPTLKRRKRLVRPAAMLFFGMINWTHTWFREGGALEAEEVADLACDVALGGLARLPLQPS